MLAAIARDSGDAESWYGLADALWHHKPDGWGRPKTVENWGAPSARSIARSPWTPRTISPTPTRSISIARRRARSLCCCSRVTRSASSIRRSRSGRTSPTGSGRRSGAPTSSRYATRARGSRPHPPRRRISRSPSSTSRRGTPIPPRRAAQSLARPETHAAQTPFQLVYAESQTRSDRRAAIAARGASRARHAWARAAGLEQPDRVSVRSRRCGGDDRQPLRRRFAGVDRRPHGASASRSRAEGGSAHATLAAWRPARGRGCPRGRSRRRSRHRSRPSSGFRVARETFSGRRRSPRST